MDFEAWFTKVRSILAEDKSKTRFDSLSPDQLYQSFSTGQSPENFAFGVSQNIEQLDASPSLPQVTNQQDEVTKQPESISWIGGVIAIGLVFGAIVLLLQMLPASVQTSQTDLVYSPSPAPTPVKKLSDVQVIEKAQYFLATWDGNPSVHSESISSLEQIHKSSTHYQSARALIAKWNERKENSDHRKEIEEKKLQKKRIAEARQRDKEEMSLFTGDGDCKVAVVEIKIRRETQSHVAQGNSRFISLYIAVKNFGTETIHVNPNDFTLADSNGNTVSHESDTYSLSNYFDAVNLSGGQQTGGWLVFLLPQDKEYILTRTGNFSSPETTKKIIP